MHSTVLKQKVLKLLATSRKEWAAEVETLLPEKPNGKVVTELWPDDIAQIEYHKGYGEAIDQVKNILERFK